MSDEERRFGGSPKVKGKKGKKDKDRHSSEEESLVDKASKPKKKVFKLPTAAHKKASDGKIKKKSVKGIRPKDDVEKKSSGPEPIFGAPLEEAVRLSPCSDGVPVPLFLRRAMDYVDEQLKTEGIYRVSPPLSGLKELRKRIEEKPTQEITFPDAHHASGIVKLFMRELPDPVLSDELQTHLLSVLTEPKSYLEPKSKMNLEQFVCHELRTRLTIERFVTLAYLLLHVHRVLEYSESNKMSFQNMGLMLWQTLRINEQALLSFLLKNAKEVFAEVRPKRFDPTAKEDQVTDFPGSKYALREELSKQEALLAALHEEAYHNAAAETLSEVQQREMQQRLWDVQAVVTQLRRKLKSLNAESGQKSQQSGPEASSDSAKNSGLTEEMFVEKQLWAVHMHLRQQIAEEQSRIDSLKRELAELVASEEQFSSDEWSESESRDDDGSQSPSTQSGGQGAAQNGTANGELENGTGADPEADLAALQARHSELVGQIIEERNATADVQAKLEMLSMDDELYDEGDVVVTRF